MHADNKQKEKKKGLETDQKPAPPPFPLSPFLNRSGGWCRLPTGDRKHHEGLALMPGNGKRHFPWSTRVQAYLELEMLARAGSLGPIFPPLRLIVFVSTEVRCTDLPQHS